MAEPKLLDIERLTHPHPNLLKYHLLASLLAGPFYPIAALASWVRFRTLRYRFDEEGVSMRWGILFRKDISLTYARLQDIHLESNVVERWLGLGRVQLQTASGSAKAEMVIEGLLEYEQVRDYLYSRMRGARRVTAFPPNQPASMAAPDELAQVAQALRDTTRELASLRTTLEGRLSAPPRPDGEE
jgi:putative membrane protein